MGEDFDNHRRIFDRGNDLQGSAAVGTVFHVDVEDAFEQPGPADARRRALPVSASLGDSVAGGAGAGTILLRNLAFGASTPWNRIRWRRGRGTRAARRYMNSSGSDLELLQAIHDADFRRVGIRAGGEAGVPTPCIRRRA